MYRIYIMSTITGSGTLSYASGTFSYTGSITGGTIVFPITITNTSALTVTFGTDLTLTTNQEYFIINGDDVTIEGNNKTVTITTAGNDYIGLVKNGDSSTDGKLRCNIQNIAVVNNEANNISACIAQDYFGKVTSGTSTSSITNCTATTSYGTDSYQGAIAGEYNYASITNCYAIVGGNISGGGGIAGNLNGGQISSCYVNQGYSPGSAPSNIFVGSNRGSGSVSNCDSGGTARWTAPGAGYLSPSSAWRSYEANTPFLLKEFNEAVTSSGTVSTASGIVGLTTYGTTLENGTVTSTQGGTWTWSNTGIGYSGLSPASYPLDIYAFNLLSDLYGTSTNFFVNDNEILFAYNDSVATSANTIVPYEYSRTVNVVSITYAANVVCFLEGTEILTARGYVKIEELNKTDQVFTCKSGFQKIYKVGREKMTNVGVEDRIKNQLYVFEKEEFKLTKDLILTGCHSILVDSLTEKEREETKRILLDIRVTEGKYRLPACLEKRTKVYPKGKYMIYQIALENPNELWNYGIYANGLLVETCCKYTMDRTFRRNSSIKNVESVDLRKMSFALG